MKMKLSKLPGPVSREVKIEEESRPDGQNDMSVSQLSHVSLDIK